MAEINAAATIMALTLSPKFDLGSTYWLLAGIAGVNPKYATLGSVALSRFSVQVALQYEVDAREAPQNFTTGYFPIGSYGPDEYPVSIYGTEVMELNEALRNAAYGFALNATLRDDENATFYRDRYKGKGNDKGNDDGIGSDGSEYSAALEAPSIVRCDSATSDVYFSGNLLSEAFENVTTLLTNGTGRYCMTAQEDNAVLEVLIRMTIEGRANFDRVILMRTGTCFVQYLYSADQELFHARPVNKFEQKGADFDRPPPGLSPFLHLTNGSQNGFDIAIDNIYNAGIQIVKGILRNWDCTFRKGIIPTNYVGDIFGSLGGTPDFGRGSVTGGVVVKPDGESGDLAKRQIARGRQGRPGNSLRNRREATHCHA